MQGIDNFDSCEKLSGIYREDLFTDRMVGGFIFIAEGTSKCEIDLGSAHLGNFFGSIS